MNKQTEDIYDALQEIVFHFGSRDMNGACCADLSFIEFMALKKIRERRDFKIQELGRALHLTKSGATRIVDRLENKGYIIRRLSPLDGRVCCVANTNKGTKAVTQAAAKYALQLEAALKEFGPQKVASIEAALKTLAQAIQKSSPFRSSVIIHTQGAGS